jgi:hypothetical protein
MNRALTEPVEHSLWGICGEDGDRKLSDEGVRTLGNKDLCSIPDFALKSNLSSAVLQSRDRREIFSFIAFVVQI